MSSMGVGGTVIKLPATELNSEGNSELRKLDEVRETEFVGDVDTATGEIISKEKYSRRKEVVYSLALWIWWFELANALSMVKIAGYPAFSQEA